MVAVLAADASHNNQPNPGAVFYTRIRQRLRIRLRNTCECGKDYAAISPGAVAFDLTELAVGNILHRHVLPAEKLSHLQPQLVLCFDGSSHFAYSIVSWKELLGLNADEITPEERSVGRRNAVHVGEAAVSVENSCVGHKRKPQSAIGLSFGLKGCNSNIGPLQYSVGGQYIVLRA